jgi:uncharacterized protein (TIGR00251 family)
MTSYTDAIKESHQGILLCLHVVPGSTQTIFPAQYNPWRHSIEIKVRSEAKENKANTETVETIARFFQLSVKDVVLVSGEKTREKTVCLKNISPEAVKAKLKRVFHG